MTVKRVRKMVDIAASHGITGHRLLGMAHHAVGCVQHLELLCFRVIDTVTSQALIHPGRNIARSHRFVRTIGQAHDWRTDPGMVPLRIGHG